MRHLPLALLLGVLLNLNLGCQKKDDLAEGAKALGTKESSTEEATPAPEEHPAITAANKVLAAIHAGDDAAIRPLLNANNQDIRDKDIRRFLEESKTDVGDVTEVTEVRAGRAENEVVAKIRVVEDEVFVVVLTLEDGKYLFEDINSPGVSRYEALEKIAP